MENQDLFQATVKGEEERNRAIIDQLIADTRLYDSAKAVKELLEFTVRLRHIAPFNAMLLHIQKPGLSFAARPKDWLEQFGRYPKPHARPLVILRNFGPVEFVYDILDTDGEPLPEVALSFPTSGRVPAFWMTTAEQKLGQAEIVIAWLDSGDYSAGHARRLTDHQDKKRLERFEVGVNRNHSLATQLVTLAHEIAHIFLGHCGADEKRGVKSRRSSDVALREVEAETVAYLVAKRTGVSPRSESYLDRYQGEFAQLDLHRILKTASAVEKLLGLPFYDGQFFHSTNKSKPTLFNVSTGSPARDITTLGTSVSLISMLEIDPTGDVYKTMARCLGAMRFIASKSANIEVDQYIVFAAIMDLGVDPIRDQEDLNLVEELADEGFDAARIWSLAKGHNDTVQLVRTAAEDLVISAAFKRKSAERIKR